MYFYRNAGLRPNKAGRNFGARLALLELSLR